MRVIFLDIDGVLNSHKRLASGYCGIQQENAIHLNAILDALPDVQLVISSAWRYSILRGEMTIKGFEHMLLVHGIKCLNRIHGHTVSDGSVVEEPDHFDVEAWKVVGLYGRTQQILRYAELHGIERYVVLDDLDLEGLPTLVQTHGDVGLTAAHAVETIRLLEEEL